METMKPSRLTWIVGPPGAGKTTYANALRSHCRVVEFTEMLRPLVEPVRMRHGILGANARLIELVRHLELRPENRDLPQLVVVAGIVEEKALFPLVDAGESVWLLLPSIDDWRRQLRNRPPTGPAGVAYDDYSYAERWYAIFTSWVHRGLPLLLIQPAHRSDLLGHPS